MTTSLDGQIVAHLNSWVFANGSWSGLFEIIGNNPLVRGFPIFFPLVALWHLNENRERRVRMLAGFLGVLAATLISVAIQHQFRTHVRPFLNPELHLQEIAQVGNLNWDHVDSFPSDTASLFFALATVVFLENRLAGTIAFLWSLLSVGLVRVALGWHYPSDIAGALILGPSCVVLSEHVHWLAGRMEKLLLRFQKRPYIVHAAVFLFLADAYWLFSGMQGIVSGIRMSARSLFIRL
jgi:membrane-associated phospholipid phosphatase